MEEKSRKPEDTPFKQQKLKSWQPILTPNWVIGTFFVVGCIFIPIGVILQYESSGVVEYAVQYDGAGADSDVNVRKVNGASCALPDEGHANQFDLTKAACTIKFNITSDMQPPIYVYYQLDNFYQNHRRYVASRSDTQLRGDANPTLTDCDPLQTTPLTPPWIKYNSTYGNATFGFLNNSNTAYTLCPCGLIANSLFNDVFWVNKVVNSTGYAAYAYLNDTYLGQSVYDLMNQEGIAWKSDIDNKFNNPSTVDDDKYYLWQNPAYRFIIPSYEFQPPIRNVTAWTRPTQAYGVKNEHFIVWMRTAGLPNFRKLYGRIDTPLPKGTILEFLVLSNFVVSTYNGKKYLVISTTSWFGGKNPFLGIAYITVGSLCMVLAILFFAKHKLSPRKLGDTRYLVWKNRS